MTDKPDRPRVSDERLAAILACGPSENTLDELALDLRDARAALKAAEAQVAALREHADALADAVEKFVAPLPVGWSSNHLIAKEAIVKARLAAYHTATAPPEEDCSTQ